MSNGDIISIGYEIAKVNGTYVNYTFLDKSEKQVNEIFNDDQTYLFSTEDNSNEININQVFSFSDSTQNFQLDSESEIYNLFNYDRSNYLVEITRPGKQSVRILLQNLYTLQGNDGIITGDEVSLYIVQNSAE
jgi:hypothetical protein